MHWRTGVDNKFSFLSFKIWCRQTPIFRRWKNVALSCSFNFKTLLASFHAASRAPCSCHSVSSWDRSSNFGALGLRWWGSPWQIYPSEGFWCRISMWRATAFVNFTRWIGFCMSELCRKINFGGFMSSNTQPNCRAFDDRRPVGPRFNSWRVSRFTTGCPDLSWLSSFNVATALLSLFFLDLSVGCSSTWRCAYEHFSPNRQPLLVFQQRHLSPFDSWPLLMFRFSRVWR